MNKFPFILFVCLATFIFTSPTFAQDVNLSWDASPSDTVAGYKIYYSQNDDSQPFVGTGATEGDSPIDVGDNLSTAISNLEDNAIYYFAVTAYDIDGNESIYSNIVSTGWQPVLTQPSNQASGLTVPTYVEWESAPTGYDVSYILFYGTNQQAVEDAHVLPTPPPVSPFSNHPPKLPLIIFISTLAILMSLLKYKSPEYRFFKPSSAIAILALGGMLAACSGGGGGSSNATISDGNDSSISGAIADTGTVDSGTVDTGTVDTGTVQSVDLGTDNFFEITGLANGTTYYWKIVAVDEVNTNLEYQSAIYNFTTAN